jgi:type I restriction-modification system DNA methylase subunit
MTGFPCEDCGKVFSLKTDLERHQNKKTPCVSKEKIINSHVNIIVEKSTNVEQINKVKKFLNFCHDMLRDKEGIVGMKALSNISMLLFLKFVSNSVKSGSIDLLQIEKYRKEEGTDKNEMFQKYKDYVKYAQYSNIIENGKLKVDSTELPIIIEYVFRHIIWHHPKTKNIFIDEIPNIKNDITYEQIFKQLDKLNWDDFDIDVKGLAYEHFLKDEMGGGDLGQFFTKREIVDYMINVIKPEIKETSTFIDPFMGTGGFITHIYNELKSLYKKNKIPFTDEIKNNLINGIEKNPQTCLLALNNLLLNMDMYPTNVRCDDSFRNFISKKYDFVLTNPPFGIKGLTYDNKTMFPDKIRGIKKEDYLPIKSNDAICLAIQMIQFILNKNGIGAIIIPDGKQISSIKEKAMINMRKMLIENNKLFQITKLPPCSFLPYTGVETMILFFKKGEETKNIKVVKLDNDYKNEIKLCDVNIKQLKKNNYSLNHKLYIENKNIFNDSIETDKFKNIFTIIKGKYQSSSIVNNNDGEGKFINKGDYESWQNIDIKLCDISGKNIFFATSFNGNGKMPIRYYEGECCCSNLMSHVKLNDDYIEKINIKFYFYYFKKLQNIFENDYSKGACNKSLDINLINELNIIIPPIPVQNQIVKELDSYYKIIENNKNILEELEVQRKGKFELLLDLCKNKKETKLGDIIKVSQGEYIKKESSEDGNYPIYGGGDKSGTINKYNRDSEYIISKDGISINCVRYVDNKFFLNHHALTYEMIDDNIKYHFIGKYLLNIQESVYKLASGTAQKGINQENFYSLQIQIPSIEDQEKIIKSMEYFDNLKEMYQSHITNTEIQIKERFEFHLNKCKKFSETNPETKENLDDETESKQKEKSKPTKKSSKTKSKKIDPDSESESESEPELKLEQEEKTSKKSSKKSKKIVSTNDDSINLEKELEELENLPNTKTIKIKEDKKEKKNKSIVNKN